MLLTEFNEEEFVKTIQEDGEARGMIVAFRSLGLSDDMIIQKLCELR